MLSFIFLLSIPLLFVVSNLIKTTPNSVYQDNLKKYELISSSIAENTALYFQSQFNQLKLLDFRLQQNSLYNPQSAQFLINEYVNSNKHITALSFLLTDDLITQTIVDDSLQIRETNSTALNLDYISDEKKYRLFDKNNSISSAFKSKFSNKPVVLIKHHIILQNGDKLGTLMAETNLNYINNYCSDFNFGNQGFCTIIDDNNTVISHHNKSWVTGLKKSKSKPILKNLKQLSSGNMKYKEGEINMLAGFSKIPSLNWGVYVSQPESEVSDPYNDIYSSILTWGSAGLLTSLFLGLILIIRITSPLKILIKNTKNIKTRSESYLMGKIPKRSPKDIKMLWKHINEMSLAYQDANDEIYSLSHSSKTDTQKVRATLRNNSISHSKNIDPYTGVTNLQTFTSELQKCIQIYKDKNMGLITFEVCNYPQLRNEKGQKAANEILQQTAHTLNKNLRAGDMITRECNSKHFSIYIHESDEYALKGTANKLKDLIERAIITWEGELIPLKILTSLLYKKIDDNYSAEQLIIESTKRLD